MSKLENETYKINNAIGKTALHFKEVVEAITKTLKPAFIYANLDGLCKENMIGVEIGVFRGNNALNILKNLSIKKLYLIDPYISYTDHDRFIKVSNLDFNIANNRLKKYSNKIKFFKDYSYNVFNKIPDDLNFVYIDGCHNYNSVRLDFFLFKDKIASNGFIGFDDTGFVSVSQAILEAINLNDFEPVMGMMDCLKKI